MAEVAATVIVLIALLGLACWPALVHRIASGLQRVVWALRAHADATGEYADAYRRHYGRRAAAVEVRQ